MFLALFIERAGILVEKFSVGGKKLEAGEYRVEVIS